MQQLIAALLLGLGLLTLYAPRAGAHEPGYVVVVHQGKVVRKFDPGLPRWLAREYDFQRWYVRGPYYRRPHPDWRHLYRLYRRDAAWHRHGHAHGRGHWTHRHPKGHGRDHWKHRHRHGR
ncbi:MAG TPA: hypothetical protein VF200_04215 [Woeseiaceae bacterium]